MAFSVGYLIDLESVKLNDVNESWIQALPLGEYTHPTHGLISITADRVSRFADNINNSVRDQALDIDYDHKERSGEAAGWVKSAQARMNGLWILVEWTAEAAKKIKDKAYRYFSPEFVDTWTHPKTNQTFNDVLFGGGITNRPFLKDILPINLSEVVNHDSEEKVQEETMTPEQKAQLLKSLGLADAATDSEILNALVAKGADKSDEVIEASEKIEDTRVKILSDQVNVMSVQLAETQKRLRETDTANKVLQFTETAKTNGYTLAIPVRERMTIALNEPTAENVEKLVSSMLSKDTFVMLGESNFPIEKKQASNVIDKIKKFAEDNKLTPADGLVKYFEENPKEYDDYRKSLMESEA